MSNQYLTFIIFIVIGCGYKNISPNNPQICSAFDKDHYYSIIEGSILISPNQSKNGYIVSSNGIRYSITANENKLINFISTNDSSFIINNIFIGMEYNQIKKEDILDEKYISGWGYNVKLKNGWKVLFSSQSVYRNHSISDSTTISAFYIDSNCD